MTVPALPTPLPPETEEPRDSISWRRRLPRRRELAPLIRQSRARLLDFSRGIQPPPSASDHLGNALYGAAQPLLGARILLRDPQLLREAFVPAGWLALACAAYALISAKSGAPIPDHFKTFYKAFAALAVAPPILFGNHYARLAQQARIKLGFGACGPREASLWFFAKRSLQSLILVALAAWPLAIFQHVPVLGLAAGAALLLWGLHWVVVDALDDARILLPGETLAAAEAAGAANAPPPWFVREFYRFESMLLEFPLVPSIVPWAVRKFARACDKLSTPWREEIELFEKNRAIGFGFAIATTVLLAVPGLNLLFRPIIIIAASHLLGQLEPGEPEHGHPGAGHAITDSAGPL